MSPLVLVLQVSSDCRKYEAHVLGSRALLSALDAAAAGLLVEQTAAQGEVGSHQNHCSDAPRVRALTQLARVLRCAAADGLPRGALDWAVLPALELPDSTAEAAAALRRDEAALVAALDSVLCRPGALHCTSLNFTALHCTALHCHP